MNSLVRFLAGTLFASTALLISQAATTPLVDHGDAWRYFKGNNVPQTDWKTVDDAGLGASWLTGNGGFGYASSASETVDCQTLLPDMQAGDYTTLYIRRQFTIDQAVSPDLLLKFRVDWDDGYIAWLDGNYIASDNVTGAPAEPSNTAIANADHESSHGGGNAQPAEIVDLGAVGTRLGVGTHTLAVMGLNGQLPSSDFILVTDLWLEPAPTGISGTLTNDTLWTASESPYAVIGDLTVASGATLTIEPGVTVECYQGAEIIIRGRLLADGTPTEPIRFMRASGAQTWERILFVDADDSLLRHCVIEHCNCDFDHKLYYDNDCNPETTPPSRTYFQAVTAVASHVDIEGCIFQNLAASGEGDAIAVISDDPDTPGEGSANIRNCQFLSIGQGVHTRYAHVVVENCYFTGHDGDNDDIDLYGESIPPSLILNNVLVNPGHDDMINPTRCSAIIIGNVIGGTPDDTGVTLRDTGSPVMMNNLVYNCRRTAISVQNECNALIVNNTLLNSGAGITFMFHSDRVPPNPYCLSTRGSQATVINCVIDNCSPAISLTEGDDPGSHVTVHHSNIEGGENGIAVSGASSYTWGEGNISATPQFVSSPATLPVPITSPIEGFGANLTVNAPNFQLQSSSPCIDAGTEVLSSISITNLAGVIADITVTVTNDFYRTPRPLDGNGEGAAALDMGAYEFLRPDADSNGDGVPDGWYAQYGLNPADPNVGSDNPDQDVHSTGEEWVADTDPTDALSFLHIAAISNAVPVRVYFQSSGSRSYTLLYTTDLVGDGAGTAWNPVSGQVGIAGSGNLDSLSDPDPTPRKYYRIEVTVP